MKSSTNKPSIPDEEIKKDFEYELKNVNFPLKEIVLSDNSFKETLFKEFATLIAKPKEDFYIGALSIKRKYIKNYSRQTYQ